MKKLVALLLCLMMVVPATLASAETAEGKVLNIWCWNDEFQSRFNAYYPEVKEIAEDKSTTTLNDGTIVKWTINPNEGNNYQNKLDEALLAQESAADDDKIATSHQNSHCLQKWSRTCSIPLRPIYTFDVCLFFLLRPFTFPFQFFVLFLFQDIIILVNLIVLTLL